MAKKGSGYEANFQKALKIGRPHNIVKLFPNSKALLVSGKVIDRALIAKGKAMTMAANGRNQLVIRGVLRAAQRAQAAIIIEIAKSEGGANAYCTGATYNELQSILGTAYASLADDGNMVLFAYLINLVHLE